MENSQRRSRRNISDIDPAYLAFLRDLPCVACAHYEFHQTTPTEAAHVGLRGLGQKCPDRQAIPLCTWHHRTGLAAHHQMGKRFFSYHGLDRDALIAQFNREYDAQFPALAIAKSIIANSEVHA